VISKEWIWVDIVKPPQVKSLPAILSVGEISRMISATKEARYQTFILTATVWDCDWARRSISPPQFYHKTQTTIISRIEYGKASIECHFNPTEKN
jgi:hypothetical protein